MAQSRSVLNDLSHALDLLESENVRLLDDNATLQEIVTDDELRIRKLLEENAKLRELLQRTWDAFHDATARKFVSVKNELRELGMEVDGC